MVFNIQTDLSIQYEYPSGTWNEIVADSYEVDIDRGITIEKNVFARPDVGTAIIRLMKSSLSDMLNGPAYKSNQNLRIRYKTSSGTYNNLFNGIIQNVSMSYQVTNKKLAIEITANDLMKVMLNTQLSSFSVTGSAASLRSFRTVMGQLGSAVQTIDSRAVLSQWLSGGSGTTQRAYTWIDTSSGDIFTQFLDAELGWMWCTVYPNQIQYATRVDITTLQTQAWDSAALTISNVHSSASTHVCMDSIDLSYNSDDIANKVKVTDSVTTSTSTVTNATSVSNYGPQLGEFEVTFDNTGASTLAAWATEVANAATPRRINSVSVPALRRDGTISNIVGPDIGNTIQIEFASTGLTTLQEVHLITRIGHSITAEHWEMNLGLWRGI
jgi:hypothetical protein